MAKKETEAALPVARPVEAKAETITVSFPPPKGMPPAALEGAQLVVKSKSDRGFRRAGYAFTPSETLIPLADLDEAKQAALAGERELTVALRLVKPA